MAVEEKPYNKLVNKMGNETGFVSLRYRVANIA
jgi:hypothetical protein